MDDAQFSQMMRCLKEIAAGVAEVKGSIDNLTAKIDDELAWYKDTSFAGMLIKAVEQVDQSVLALDTSLTTLATRL